MLSMLANTVWWLLSYAAAEKLTLFYTMVLVMLLRLELLKDVTTLRGALSKEKK